MVRQRKLREKWTTVADRREERVEDTMEPGREMMGPSVPSNGYVFNHYYGRVELLYIEMITMNNKNISMLEYRELLICSYIHLLNIS